MALYGANMMVETAYVYPPLHFAILDGIYFIGKEYLLTSPNISDFTKGFTLIGYARLVSAAMGFLAALILLAILKMLLADTGKQETPLPIFFVMLVALNTTYVFYCHTTNAEIPYIFWWLCSIWTLLVGEKHGKYWFIVSACCCACAVATKDQAAMLYPLFIPLFFLRKRQPRKLALYIILAITLYFAIYLIYELWYHDQQLFRKHIQFMLENKTWFCQYTHSFSDRIQLLLVLCYQLYAIFDLPALIAIVAVVVSSRRCPQILSPAGIFLLTAGGYLAAILLFMGHSHTRYMLPVYICIIIAVAEIAGRNYREWLLRLAMPIIVVQVVYGLSIGYSLYRHPAEKATRFLLNLPASQKLVAAELSLTYSKHPYYDDGRWHITTQIKDWGLYSQISQYQATDVIALFPQAADIFIVQPDYLLIEGNKPILRWLNSPQLLGKSYKHVQTFLPYNFFAKDLPLGLPIHIFHKQAPLTITSDSPLSAALSTQVHDTQFTRRLLARNIAFIANDENFSHLRNLLQHAAPTQYQILFGDDIAVKKQFLAEVMKDLGSDKLPLGRKFLQYYRQRN